MAQFKQLVVAEIERLAAPGFTPETDPCVILDGPMLELCFQQVDVPAITKNPWHPDIETSDRRADIERLVALGASVRETFERHTWMQDPEGNDSASSIRLCRDRENQTLSCPPPRPDSDGAAPRASCLERFGRTQTRCSRPGCSASIDPACTGRYFPEDLGQEARPMTNIANTEQYDAWNGASGQRWAADPDGRDRMLAPVGRTLIAAAQLISGEAVLDIGCGCGSTTLAAANAVGPTGSATGVDLSELMLDVARQRADVAGITNLTLMQADAQVHDFDPGSIDVVISRFGTMFFADADAAFTNIATALRNGGRLCMATWQPVDANDWLTIPGAELLRYGVIPDSYAGEPNMFSQSDPDTVTRVLDHAGYVDIALESVHPTLTLGVDPREATDHFAATSASQAVLETVPPEQRPAALDAVCAVLADYADGTGVHLGAATWIVTATRPA